jgi:hypothetical protein
MHLLFVCRSTKPALKNIHQFNGFRMYRRAVQDRLGATVELVHTHTLDDIERAVRGRPADAAFVTVPFSDPPDEVTALCRGLREQAPGRKLVFLDDYDPTASPHFDVLPFVDLYAKRQILRDVADYLKPYAGGYVFSDYMQNHFGFDLGAWQIGSRPDPAQVGKIVVGWNLGVAPRYRRLLRLTRAAGLPWSWRPIDVHARWKAFHTSQWDWKPHYRLHAQQQLAPLLARYRCAGPGDTHRRRYWLELLASKIVVSPFGWGEICYRDFEAVCAGALLVKPSMGHLRTSPDIFVAGETYVPVSWDFADLAETCRRCLADPAKSMAIVRNAQAALHQYFERGGFVADVRRVVAAAGLPDPRVPCGYERLLA